MSKNGINKPRIAVIGAGISGLAAAFRLTRPGADGSPQAQVIVLEKSSRPGGLISSRNFEDCLLELGPDAFLTDKKEALELCKELGLQDQLIQTNEKFRRSFVAFNGHLHELPDGFAMIAPTKLIPFFCSSLFSLVGKFRILLDLFLPKAPNNLDESLAQFVRRRLGKEALERIAQPMLGGIYTADPETLSLRATMPRFMEMEQKYGSIIRGLIKERKKKDSLLKAQDAGARYSMFASLPKGLGQMVEALISKLPQNCLHYNSQVERIEPGTNGAAYNICVADGKLYPVDAVIICTPTYVAAKILKSLDTELTQELKKIQYASSAVLNQIYKRENIQHLLNGFGFVVPIKERRSIIACSFSSVKFQNRCSPDKVLLRIFVGGALQKDLYDLQDQELECLVWEDLRTYLGVNSAPLFSTVTRHPRSMPQYQIGHMELVAKIKERLKDFPSLFLAGNSYSGVGIPDSIRSAQEAVKSALESTKSNHPEVLQQQ